MSKQPKYNHRRNKYSKYQQWQEQAYAPVATDRMSKDEILMHQKNLIKMYDCEPADLTYDFIKIKDDDDEDRDDCLWLEYYLQCVIHGTPTRKVVYSIKVPIPEDIRKACESKQRQEATIRKTRLLTNSEEPVARTLTEGVVPPRVRRPVLQRK